MATPSASRLRSLLIDVLSRSPPCSALLLSGGTDTAALAALSFDPALNGRHKLKHGITTGTSSSQDIQCAAKIASNRGLKHHVVPMSDDASELLSSEPGGLLELAIRILKRFDPMEIRNDIVVLAALLKCKELGIDRIWTGDGADELFAGYSFSQRVPRDKLREHLDRMCSNMTFGTATLAKALGIEVVQPFLDPVIQEFAKTLDPSELIGPATDGREIGKLVLRYAVPESESAWRNKEPIEQGSGMTAACRTYFARTPLDPTEAARIKTEDGVIIRDAEHLHYFRVFKGLFGTEKGIEIPGWPRHGSDPCLECGWQLESPTQLFCVVCGCYPARTMAVGL